LNNNRVDDAKDVYLNALTLNPTIKEIHANLGFISIINEEYKEAEIFLKQAIALDPDYLLAYENLFVLSKKINDSKATRLYLQKILNINPQHKLKKLPENYTIEKKKK